MARDRASKSVLIGPPPSLVLSPIDSYGGWVWRTVGENGCITHDQLSPTILSVDKNKPKHILRAYLNSMNARLSQAIHVEGAKASCWQLVVQAEVLPNSPRVCNEFFVV